MSILGPNHCAGSLPELGVIVNDRQWVISELPQLGQTLSPGAQEPRCVEWVVQGQLGAGPGGPGTVVGAPVCREPSAVPQHAFPGYLAES